MKKVSQIMEELGFRQDASESVKKAFIKNLLRHAEPASPPVETPVQSNDKSEAQLSFTFADEVNHRPSRQKAG